MKMEQKQVQKCPVCDCDFFGENHKCLYLDWIITLKSEDGFSPILRCSGCYSPFYIRKKDGSIETYLGNATD